MSLGTTEGKKLSRTIEEGLAAAIDDMLHSEPSLSDLLDWILDGGGIESGIEKRWRTKAIC